MIIGIVIWKCPTWCSACLVASGRRTLQSSHANVFNYTLALHRTKKNPLSSFQGNLIGPVVTTLITGGLESLLHMPMGCGEQTMIFLAPNVYVMQYLLETRQVTADIESKAYRMIQSGE